MDRSTTSWDARIQQLLLYKQEHGHVRVPNDAKPPWAELGSWVGYVRAQKRSGHLKEERVRQLEGLGFDWRVDGQTLESTKGLLNEHAFRAASGFTNISRYREDGLVSPAGKGMSGTALSFFYHPSQLPQLRNQLGITLESTEGLLSEKQFIKASGLTQTRQYRTRGLITPVGFGMSPSGVAPFYHPRQIGDLRARLGITLDCVEGLLNQDEFRKASGLTQIASYRRKRLVEPVGFAITNSGVSAFYHPSQAEQLRRRLGITLTSTDGLLDEQAFAKASRLSQIAQYREKGLIKPVGTAMTAGGCVGAFYHPPIRSRRCGVRSGSRWRAPRAYSTRSSS